MFCTSGMWDDTIKDGDGWAEIWRYKRKGEDGIDVDVGIALSIGRRRYLATGS